MLNPLQRQSGITPEKLAIGSDRDCSRLTADWEEMMSLTGHSTQNPAMSEIAIFRQLTVVRDSL